MVISKEAGDLKDSSKSDRLRMAGDDMTTNVEALIKNY